MGSGVCGARTCVGLRRAEARWCQVEKLTSLLTAHDHHSAFLFLNPPPSSPLLYLDCRIGSFFSFTFPAGLTVFSRHVDTPNYSRGTYDVPHRVGAERSRPRGVRAQRWTPRFLLDVARGEAPGYRWCRVFPRWCAEWSDRMWRPLTIGKLSAYDLFIINVCFAQYIIVMHFSQC